MNKLILENYIPMPKIKAVALQQPKNMNNPIIKAIHGFKNKYPPKYILSTNKVRETVSVFSANYYQYRLEIQNLILFAQNIDSKFPPFTALDNKLYYFDNLNIIEYDKNVIFKDTSDLEKDKLIPLFNALYEFCTEFQKIDLWYNYIQYYNFFIINRDADSISDFNTFFSFLPNFNHENNNQFLLTNDQYIIFLLNKKLVIAMGNDILDYNTYFFYNYLKIKSPRYQQYLEKLMKALTKYIHTILVNNEFKPNIKNRIFTYVPSNYKYCQTMIELDINAAKSFITNYTYNVVLNPITINNINMMNIHDIERHIPETFLKTLENLSHNDLKIVKDLAILIANCFLPYPFSKKLFVINTENEQDIQIAKNFIKRILCSSNYDCEIINENFGHTINSFCSSEMRDKLNLLRFSNVKAAFLNRDEKCLSSRQAEVLSTLINNTSNNTNHEIVNNIQLILFQCEHDTNDLRNDDIITIDLSSYSLTECNDPIPEEDLIWARIYFALYGYTLIKKQTSSVPKDDSEISESDFTAKILKEFLNECFVDPKEAAKRIESRKDKIAEFKKENSKITDIELTKKLSDFPVYFTFRDEFLLYIQKFIDTQYDADIIKRYDLTPKKLLRAFRKDKNYFETYPFEDVNIKYFTHKKGSAFKYLSLKEPWHKLEIELESKNINNVAHSGSQGETTDLTLYNEIKRDIDFSQLNFPEIKAEIKIT